MENDKTKHGIQYKVTVCMGLAGSLLGLLVKTLSAQSNLMNLTRIRT